MFSASWHIIPLANVYTVKILSSYLGWIWEIFFRAPPSFLFGILLWIPIKRGHTYLPSLLISAYTTGPKCICAYILTESNVLGNTFYPYFHAKYPKTRQITLHDHFTDIGYFIISIVLTLQEDFMFEFLDFLMFSVLLVSFFRETLFKKRIYFEPFLYVIG